MFVPAVADLNKRLKRVQHDLHYHRCQELDHNLAIIGTQGAMNGYNNKGHTLNGDFPAMVLNWDIDTNMQWLNQQVQSRRVVHVLMTSANLAADLANPNNRNRRFTVGAEVLAFLMAGYYIENVSDGIILRPPDNILQNEFQRILTDFKNLGNHNSPLHGNSFWNKYRHRLIADLNG